MWDYEATSEKIAVIPYAIAGGLLGYRQLLVKETRLTEFSELKTADALRERVAGQGRGWPDVAVYESNNFRVTEVDNYEQLMPMLVAGRMDYVPVGVEEALPTLVKYGAEYPGVAIVPNLVIYYPMPVYLVVCKCQPELIARLETSLAAMTEDGSLERLFRQHKQSVINRLTVGNPLLVKLNNPALPGFAQDPGPVLLQH